MTSPNYDAWKTTDRAYERACELSDAFERWREQNPLWRTTCCAAANDGDPWERSPIGDTCDACGKVLTAADVVEVPRTIDEFYAAIEGEDEGPDRDDCDD